MEKYLEMTIAQLKEEAKTRGIKGVSTMKKQELAELLSAADRMMAQKQKEKKEEEKPKAAPADKQSTAKPAEEAAPRQEYRPQQNRPMQARPMQQNGAAAPRPQERPVARPAQQAQDGVLTQAAPAQTAPAAQPTQQTRFDPANATAADIQRLDSGETRVGILEIMSENFGFIRCDNYLPGENDVYVSPAQIRRFGLKTGDIICGNTKIRAQNEKFSALLYIKNVNGISVEEIMRRKRFEDLTPIFPNERIHLETPGCSLSMRMVDLISPIGKGQRGMIVSQPKAGKTTLLKQIAKAIKTNHPNMHMIILLIDERPEEVTDMKESIQGEKVEVIYSTFDELPENHKRVSEMVIERAKRLVEQKEDVVILLDSITRLARAYNLTVAPSGRTLSGGLDPAALHMPKKFFGAARNMREGGSLTILATALVDTGSRMDDVVFEEFKGTGNMELQLDRNLSERRVFPAIDLPRSSTRRDDLLLTKEEQEATSLMRRMFNGSKAEESLENIMRTFQSTKNNADFVNMIKKFR
ncbi:MAG: transcription termination factor Rho [Lachnospiraceae bacterium]|nr:transcription termination factor Rho [Lachnospiraceae bacterium]